MAEFGFLGVRVITCRQTRPSEYSVPLLDPHASPPGVVLLWNRVLVQSLRPPKYHRYCFDAPALPLALAPAMRFSFSELPLATV
jgi:hypothetical protein